MDKRDAMGYLIGSIGLLVAMVAGFGIVLVKMFGYELDPDLFSNFYMGALGLVLDLIGIVLSVKLILIFWDEIRR